MGRRSRIESLQFHSLKVGEFLKSELNWSDGEGARGRTWSVAIPQVDDLMRARVLTQTLCSKLKRPKAERPADEKNNGRDPTKRTRTGNSSLTPHPPLGLSGFVGPTLQTKSRSRALRAQWYTLLECTVHAKRENPQRAQQTRSTDGQHPQSSKLHPGKGTKRNPPEKVVREEGSRSTCTLHNLTGYKTPTAKGHPA